MRLAHVPTPRVLAWTLVALCSLGCPRGLEEPAYPSADVYQVPSDFTGEWIGEVEAVTGTLRIQELGAGRFYGAFRSDDGVTRYALSIDHVMKPGPDDTPRPSNLVTFTWQDGRGDRGAGWLLINREDSALTGEFGRGSDGSGFGAWTFIRLE